MTLLATASPLLKMLYSSVVAGVGVSVVFAIALLGVTRSSDMRRSGRSATGAVYAALGLLGFGLCLAAVVYGLVLVAHKT